MKIKGESIDWNSIVFSLLLKTDKSMINEAYFTKPTFCTKIHFKNTTY